MAGNDYGTPMAHDVAGTFYPRVPTEQRILNVMYEHAPNGEWLHQRFIKEQVEAGHGHNSWFGRSLTALHEAGVLERVGDDLPTRGQPGYLGEFVRPFMKHDDDWEPYNWLWAYRLAKPLIRQAA